MSGDFFDGDALRKVAGPDAAGKMTAGKMSERKDKITDQVAGAISEIENLKKKQALLEKEKGALEECATKQEEYEKGKREMLEKLNGALVLLDKEEDQATKMCELLAKQ